MVKELLSQRGIDFKERDVSRNPSYAQELAESTGQMGVPVTIINGQIVVGFDRGRLEQVLSQTQPGQRLSFGASIADASKITARRGSGIILGAYIGRIRQGSVADRLGLAPGDIITELNMKHLTNASDLEHALSGLNAGNRISLVFIRGNKTMTAEDVI
jgi:glutaredoxin 3